MKKRTLAINSFLAVTTMAWLGQPLPANSTERRPGVPISAIEQVRNNPVDIRQLRYRAADRALLRGHLRGQHNDPQRLFMPGQILDFNQLSSARTLPAALQVELTVHEQIVDLVIDAQIVRMHRQSREIIDVV